MGAEPVDPQRDHIARLQPDPRGAAHADPAKRSGVKEVTGLEYEELAEVVDDEVGVGRACIRPFSDERSGYLGAEVSAAACRAQGHAEPHRPTIVPDDDRVR